MKNQNNTQRPAGFFCPNETCGGFIPVSLVELLNAQSFVCPQCSLELRLNTEGSQKAFEILNKVQQAEKRVQDASVFRG